MPQPNDLRARPARLRSGERVARPHRRSTRLSTATFDAAQHKTREPRFTSRVTYSTTVVVFPRSRWAVNQRDVNRRERVFHRGELAKRPDPKTKTPSSRVECRITDRANLGGTFPNMTSTRRAPAPTSLGSPFGARPTRATACAITDATSRSRVVPDATRRPTPPGIVQRHLDRRITHPVHHAGAERFADASQRAGRIAADVVRGEFMRRERWRVGSRSFGEFEGEHRLPRRPPRRSAHFRPRGARPRRCAVSGRMPRRMDSDCSVSATRSSSKRRRVLSTKASSEMPTIVTAGAGERWEGSGRIRVARRWLGRGVGARASRRRGGCGSVR